MKSYEALKATTRLYPAYITELINFDSKKERFKEYLTDMKDYYKKEIEDKTGIDLGEVNLELSSEKALNFSYNLCIEELEKGKLLSVKEQKKISNQIWSSFGMYYLTSKPLFSLAWFPLAASWNNNDKSITFSDQYFQRILNKTTKKTHDYTMVHELSHVLWDRVNSNDEHKIKNYKQWSEGFAEYATKDYFNDIILPSSLDFLPKGKHYKIGYEKVKKIIEKKGLESFFEIPNNWQEFEKELTEK